VLLAFLLLSLSCASSPLLLLLEEPRSRDGIRSRGSSGGAHARQTIKLCCVISSKAGIGADR